MGDVLDLPIVVIVESGLSLVTSGTMLLNAHLLEGCPVREGWVQIKDEKQNLLALGTVEATAMGVNIHPRRVFSG